jgi:hypothetical protein
MSFSLTTKQMRDRSKTVTRRCGWWFLRPGDKICAVEKGMGLKKGEKVKRIGLIEIDVVGPQPLRLIDAYDVAREGFPYLTPEQFIEMFCECNKCTPDEIINRIEFKHLL